MTKQIQEGETPVSLLDIWSYCKKIRMWVLLSALACGSLASIYKLRSTPVFTAKATFVEKSASNSSGSFIKDLLTSQGSSKTSTGSLILSKPLLEPVIKKLGLQAHVSKIAPSSSPGFLNTVRDNLRITLAKLRGREKQSLVLPDLQQDITLRQIQYEGEFPLSFTLTFQSENTFTLIDSDKKNHQGCLGTPFVSESFSFLLEQASDTPLSKSQFSVRLLPLEKVTEGLKASLSITPNTQAPNLLDLQFSHRDRHLAASFLNHVMWEYQSYLKSESDLRTKKQLSYLKQRQETLFQGLDEKMSRYSTYLANNLGSGGFTDSQSEAAYLASHQGEWRSKLLELKLELKMLDAAFEQPEIFYVKDSIELGSNADGNTINDLLTRIRDLTLQVHTLEAALQDPQHQMTIEEKKQAEGNCKRLNTHLSILKTRLKQCIHSHKESAEQHVALIHKNIDELNKQQSGLPEKWLLEEKMRFHKSINEKVMEKVTELVENTIISHNLDVIESHPLDLAIPPTVPDTPPFVMYAILGCLFGSFLSTSFSIGKHYKNGIPATADTLNLMRMHYCGMLAFDKQPLHNMPSSSLDTLKNLSLAISSSDTKHVLVANPYGPQFTFHLAEILKTRGERVLVIDCPQSSCNQSGTPGLLQYLQEKTTAPSIHKAQGIDTISSGGSDLFANELLHSQKFSSLLESFQENFDYILLQTKSPIHSLDMQVLYNLSHHAIIALKDEKLHELEVFRNSKVPSSFVLT